MEGQIKYPAFSGYRGAKCWEVEFEHKKSIVRAPDEVGAIIAAARELGSDWRDPDYHGTATVTPRRDIAQKLKQK